MLRQTALVLLAVSIRFIMPETGHCQSHPLTPEELTTRAAIVAVGTVSQVRAEWNPGRTRILTHVTVSVDQYLKGGTSQALMNLTVPGGELGEIGEVYSHTARFKEQERVVVFAEPDAGGALRVSAGDQGKITITMDRLTGRPMAAEGVSLEVLAARIRNAAGPAMQR
jgi:hypothetical protein